MYDWFLEKRNLWCSEQFSLSTSWLSHRQKQMKHQLTWILRTDEHPKAWDIYQFDVQLVGMYLHTQNHHYQEVSNEHGSKIVSNFDPAWPSQLTWEAISQTGQRCLEDCLHHMSSIWSGRVFVLSCLGFMSHIHQESFSQLCSCHQQVDLQDPQISQLSSLFMNHRGSCNGVYGFAQTYLRVFLILFSQPHLSKPQPFL